MKASRLFRSPAGASLLCVVALVFATLHHPACGCEIEVPVLSDSDEGGLLRLRGFRISMELLSLFDLFSDFTFVSSLIAGGGVSSPANIISFNATTNKTTTIYTSRRVSYITVFGYRIDGSLIVCVALLSLIISCLSRTQQYQD